MAINLKLKIRRALCHIWDFMDWVERIKRHLHRRLIAGYIAFRDEPVERRYAGHHIPIGMTLPKDRKPLAHSQEKLDRTIKFYNRRVKGQGWREAWDPRREEYRWTREEPSPRVNDERGSKVSVRGISEAS